MLTPSALSAAAAARACERATAGRPLRPDRGCDRGGRSGRADDGPPDWLIAISGSTGPAWRATTFTSPVSALNCPSSTKLGAPSTTVPQPRWRSSAKNWSRGYWPITSTANSCATWRGSVRPRSPAHRAARPGRRGAETSSRPERPPRAASGRAARRGAVAGARERAGACHRAAARRPDRRPAGAADAGGAAPRAGPALSTEPRRSPRDAAARAARRCPASSRSHPSVTLDRACPSRSWS